MAKIQIKNSFITSSAQITISSSLVRFSDNIRAKGITGSFSGSFAGSNLFVQGGNSFGTTALLGTNDNQPLVLETNASEKMRITTGGNVGIGTSSPIAKLHILGSGGGTDYVYQQWSYTSNVGVYDLILKQTVTSGVVRYNFSMNNASTAYNDVLVLDRGCVGIGTSFPLSKLDVRGTMYVNYGSNGTGYIQTNGTDSDLQITTATNLTTLLNTGTSGAMAFGAGNSERMRILSGGNIGIGTSSPTQKLEVAGYAMAGESSYRTSIYGNASGAWIAFGDTSNTVSLGRIGAYNSLFNINSVNGDTSFQYNGSEKMRITTGGNVGIGTTSPTAKLQVGTQMYGSAPDANYFVVGNENFSGPGPVGGITGYPATANRNQVTASLFDVAGGWESVNGYHALLRVSSYDKINSTPALTILNNGNLGLGTNSPSHQLTISRPTQASAYQVNFNTDGGISDGNYTGIRFSQGATGGTELGNIRLWYFTTGATALSLGVRNATQALYVATDGNIGIGTTNPVAKLHITGSSTAAVFQGNVGIGTTSFTYSTSNRGLLELYGATDSLIALRNSNNPFYIQKFSTNAYLNNTDNGAFILYTNNTERMRIAADGNVGIGTSSPVAKLDINGTSNFAPNVYHSIGGQKFFAGSGGTFSYIYTGTTALNFINGSDTSTLMSLLNNGNLGIGTTTPAYKFHIYSGSMYVQGGAGAGVAKNYTSFSRLIFDTDHSDSTRGPNKITLYDSGGWVGGFGVSSDIVGYYSGGHHVWLKSTSQTAFTEYMRLNSSGNLGIGTSSPPTMLQVVGTGVASVGTINIRGSQAHLGLTTAGGTFKGWYGYFNSSTHGSDLDLNIKTGYAGASNIRFAANGDATQLFISGSGNVGIGTTTPASILHLNGTAPTILTLSSTSYPSTYLSTFGVDSGARAFLIFGNNGENQIRAGRTSTGGYLDFYTNNTVGQTTLASDGNFVMRLSAGGNVGIGTSSPAYKLDVNTANDSAIRIRNGGGGANNGLSLSVGSGSPWLDITEGVEFRIKGNTYANIGTWNSGNNTKLLIDSNGNIGIGTTSPSSKFVVNNNGGTGNAFYVDVGNINGVTTLFEHTGNTTPVPFRLKKSGFSGTASNYGLLYLYMNDGTVGNGSNLYFTANDSAGNEHEYGGLGAHIITNTNGAESGDLVFYTSDAGTIRSEKVRIKFNGNVGIGTSSPAVKLVVNGSSIITNPNPGANSAVLLVQDEGTATTVKDGTTLRVVNNGSAATFSVFEASSNVSDFVILNNGNVGIGTTSPGGKLEVRTNANSNYVFSGTSTSGYTTTFTMDDTASYFGHDSGVRSLILRTNSTARLTVLGGGNVGIGTTNPSTTLTVIATNNTGSRIQLGTNSTSTFMDANKVNDFMVLTAPFGNNPASVSNGGAKWGIKMNGSIDSINTKGKAACIYAVSEENSAGYNRMVGLALHTSAFDLDSAERVRIKNDGNVGIGSTSPVYKLDVNGTFRSTGDLWTNGNIVISRAGAYLYINGTNSDSEIVWQANGSNRWAAGMNVGDATENFNVYNYTTATTNFTILKANGNVGIGSTAPNDKLDVVGRVYAYRYIAVSSNASLPAYATDTSTGMFNAATNQIGFTINGTEKLRINTDGNLGIGTTSPAQKLHVVGAVYGTTYGQFGTSVASGTNSSYAVFGSNSAVVGVKINIDSNVNRNDLVVSGSTGNVGIGTSRVLSKLNAYASGSNLSVFRVDGGNGTLFEVTDQLSGSLFSVNDVSGLPLLEVFSNNRVVAGKYGSNALVVSGSSVGIGTSRPAYRLQVSGSFAATTKSFVINHPDPAKSDKQLVHGVTEGPEHTVFVRGKLENNNIIQLPDYWQHLVHEESITVTLTPNKYYQQLYVKNVTDTTIEVGSETDKPINCYYYIVGERKDIPKLITEI